MLCSVSPSSLPSGEETGPSGATIPTLNSRPGAKAKLFLDFDGDVARAWEGYDVTATPAYDSEGDPSVLSDSEADDIREIWARVAEKFSPFDLNVTTADPGTLVDKVSLRAVIGGDGAWTGGDYGGIAYVGGFFNSLSNTVYVFPANLGGGFPAYVAEAIAHEAGHAFGLEHQSDYDGAGNLVEEYSHGNGSIAPIMGNSYNTRGLWWSGTTTSVTDIQDDLAILAGGDNGFGYRPDDHGDGIRSATPLAIVGNQGNGAGVIERTTDKDFFSFVTATGNIDLVVSPAAFGAMLDLRLELYTFDGTLVASQDTLLLGETITLFVEAGSYRLGVFSAADEHGDIGQFTVSANLVTPTLALETPANFNSAQLPDGKLQLTWDAHAWMSLRYRVQRSTDGGSTWQDYAETAAEATSFIDDDVDAGGIYVYRLCAFDDVSISEMTGRMTVVVAPRNPRGVTATALTTRKIRVGWESVDGATAYVIERAKGDTTTFKPIGLASASRTSFDDTGLGVGTTYRYRVRAVNAGGYSSPSSRLTATTLTEAGAPDNPSKLSVTAVTRYQIKLAWQDNSNDEAGFKIQWQSPGRQWETLGKVAADRTSVSVYLWRDDATFRVSAYNDAGRSRYSAEVPISAASRPKSSGAQPDAVFSSKRISRKAMQSLLAAKPELLV